MATFTLADLTTPMSVDEIKTSIYSVIAQTGVSTTNWKPGAVVRTLITAVAIVLSAFSILLVNVAQAGWLELSAGGFLTLVAHHVYNVDRLDATFARGLLDVFNASGLTFTYDTHEFVVQNIETGALYWNVAPFTSASATSIAIVVEAQVSGSSSSALPFDVATVLPAITGLTIQNDSVLTGNDTEDDAALKIRCRDKLGSLSPMGPPDAYGFAARNATRLDGSAIGVTRLKLHKDGLGNVDIYCATGTGGVLGDANDVTTDLGAVNDAIQKRAAPLGITARVHTADTVPLDITYSIWLYNTSGLTEQQIKDAIALQLQRYFAAQPVGGNVIGVSLGAIYKAGLQAAIVQTAPLLSVVQVSIALPTTDRFLLPSQVAVLNSLTATAIVQLAAPGSI